MNRFINVSGGALWFLLVFWCVLYISFPSTKVGFFVSHVVDEQSGGQYQVAMDDVRPWWVGLSGTAVVLSASERPATEPAEPIFLADRVSVRLSPWALLRRGRQFHGEVTIGDAVVDAQVSGVEEDGQLRWRRIFVDLTDMPIETLVGLMSTSGEPPLEGSGEIDGTVELRINEGMSKADGEISLLGDGLRIDKISAPAMEIVGLEVNAVVEELDLRLSGTEGLLQITRGALRSSMLNADISGDLTLDDHFDRSRVKLAVEVELGDWAGGPLESFQSMAESNMSSAKCDDGRYHYSVNTTVGRLGFNDLKAERCKGSSRPTRAPVSGSTAPAAGAAEGAAPTVNMPLEGAAAPLPETSGTRPVRPRPPRGMGEMPLEDEVPPAEEDPQPIEDLDELPIEEGE